MIDPQLLLLLDRFIANYNRHVELVVKAAERERRAEWAFTEAEHAEFSHLATLIGIDKRIVTAKYDCKDDPTIVERLTALRASVAARKP